MSEKDFIDTFGMADNRPEKGGWAKGGYYGTCMKCRERFLGDKRASECADCAYKEDTQSNDHELPTNDE